MILGADGTGRQKVNIIVTLVEINDIILKVTEF